MKSLTRFEIVDEQGKPVTDAGLTVVRSSVGAFPEMTAVPDERGIVTLFLPAGRFTLRAVAPGDRAAEVTIETPARASETVRIELS